MIGIVAKLTIKDGAQAQFENLANQLVTQSREEAGCKGYTLWKTEQACVYAFVEYYADESAIQAHMQSEHYRQIGRQLGPLMEGKPEIMRLMAMTL